MDVANEQIVAKAALAGYVALLEEALGCYIRDCPYPESKVTEAMAYSLLGGGKRIRGALVLAFYRLYHEDIEAVLPYACAVEMIHAYSLIHDDLPCMDDDDMRRGKPSCHKAYGEATALLAGDALLTLAFETVADPRGLDRFPPEIVLQAIWRLAAAAGYEGMIGGQVIDLALEGQQATVQQLDRMNEKKTGALIRASAHLGCLLAGAREDEVEAGLAYAGHIGAAFQIIDDVLDVAGDEEVLGKPVGSDAAKGKSTYVGLLGLVGAERQARQYNAQAKEALRRLPGDTGFLRGLADILTERQY